MREILGKLDEWTRRGDASSARSTSERQRSSSATVWADGMSASLWAGLAVANDFEWVIVTLGAQPFVGAAAIAAVAQSAERTGDHVMAVRARYGGRPGHPVALRRQLFPVLARMRGNFGARELLKRVVVEEIKADGLGSEADVDTIADLEALT
jgi:CTP:molybdopterin cytidylyltransferase MocA